ncbi:MAG: guanylate kinase [Chthoniobacterales bacterium]|nr:guanylate kinase [Chthoniobacterales bacterium]
MWSNIKRRGILLVLSAPSGAGKTTLLESLKRVEKFVFSISCTTRPARPGEQDGIHYYFISEDEFDQKIQKGEFLEYATVHHYRYGTLLQPVMEALARGEDMLLDIDIVGAASLRASGFSEVRESLVDVFLFPPSLEELRRRLIQRGTEPVTEIEERIERAVKEAQHWREFRYVIPPLSPEEMLSAVRAILQAERFRASRYF